MGLMLSSFRFVSHPTYYRERAFAGWFHINTTCLSEETGDAVRPISTMVMQEFTDRSILSGFLPGTAAAARADEEFGPGIDLACDGRWVGMPRVEQAFNLGYADAYEGIDEPCRGFEVEYGRGQREYQESLS